MVWTLLEYTPSLPHPFTEASPRGLWEVSHGQEIPRMDMFLNLTLVTVIAALLLLTRYHTKDFVFYKHPCH